jgi:hypothetical protein
MRMTMESIRPSTNPPPTLLSALAALSPHSLACRLNRCLLPRDHVFFRPRLAAHCPSFLPLPSPPPHTLALFTNSIPIGPAAAYWNTPYRQCSGLLLGHPKSVPPEHCRYGPNVFSPVIRGMAHSGAVVRHADLHRHVTFVRPKHSSPSSRGHSPEVAV